MITQRFAISAAFFVVGSAGCASQQLRPIYERIEIGKSIPANMRMPDGVKWRTDKLVWTIEHQPKQSTVSGSDGIKLLVDQTGCVTAKYYWCNQEEGVLWLLWFVRRDKDLWEFDISRASAATTKPNENGAIDQFNQIAAVCSGLYVSKQSPNRLGAWTTPPDEIVQTAKNHHKVIGKNLYYEQVRERKLLPMPKKTVWRLRMTDTNRVQVSAETDIDVSLVVWAATGYAHLATHGGKID